jgi:chitinase
MLRGICAPCAAQGKSRLLLSFAAPAGPYNYNNIDLAAVGPLIDWINLMTYDLHGPGETRANAHTPVHDCSSPSAGLDIHHAVEYYKARVGAAKINMGLATYGKSFTLAAGEIRRWAHDRRKCHPYGGCPSSQRLPWKRLPRD